MGATADATLAVEAAGSKINLTVDGLEHVYQRHTAQGVLSRGKSIFFDKRDVPSLLRAAENHTPRQQPFGLRRLERVVDAGRAIGFDRNTGSSTSVYTVITEPNGDLVTAFPGRP